MDRDFYKKHYTLLMVATGMAGKHMTTMEIKFLTINVCNINILRLSKKVLMPSEDDVNAKIQEIKDAEIQKANDKISAQNKLKALGLTDAEIEAL